jgi:cystathionine beta-lyase/cystathionine gamma-synthase
VQSSTFVFSSSAEMRRYLDGDEELYLYTRDENPTLRELERVLASLEGGEDALALASGMAAATVGLLTLARPGEGIVASASLYGGTARLVREILPRFGFATRTVSLPELADPGTRLGPPFCALMVESPTNPTVEVVDLAAVGAAARARGAALMVDNTFATPILQRPLELGADLVMHSLTKALAGHSDILGGALVGSRARIGQARDWLRVLGPVLDPHAAFLALRGLKTLHLRVARQGESALALARFLEAHPKVRQVRHPGLPSHPAHALAARQMRGFGSMLAFVLDGGLEAAERFYDGLGLIARAASLGGVETLVSLPVHTSHHGLTDDQLRAAGVDPGTVRVSVGVEDVEDLIADAERALRAV